jgi:biofilm PGA synthesis N-glycosyltransferase PgaC
MSSQDLDFGTKQSVVPASGSVSPTAADRVGEVRAWRARRYVSVAAKFWISVAFALVWVSGSVWLSLPWLHDLNGYVAVGWAIVAVALVAYIPALLMSFMAMSLLLDRQPPLRVSHPTAGVTIIIAARNEQASIEETLRHAVQTDYDGPVTFMLADNGSTDATCVIAGLTAAVLGVELVIVHEPKPGKANALNCALRQVETPYVVTVDADTLLHEEALRRLVSRLESAPADTVAVAGAVMIRNSRCNLLTRMQEWDYFLGIAAVKRMQGLYQSTLVAQGAFSLFRTGELRRIGGWPDAIGEDIVVTWRLLEAGNRVLTEPTAIAFTDAPTKVAHFMRQRARWARGMVEALRNVPPWHQRRVLARFVAGIDLLIPLLDVGYGLIWVPGLVLAAFGFPVIVGTWTLVVLPITLLVYGGLRGYQRRKVFGPLRLNVRRNRVGYLAFILGYQLLCSTASLAGYAQEIAGARRRWK